MPVPYETLFAIHALKMRWRDEPYAPTVERTSRAAAVRQGTLERRGVCGRVFPADARVRVVDEFEVNAHAERVLAPRPHVFPDIESDPAVVQSALVVVVVMHESRFEETGVSDAVVEPPLHGMVVYEKSLESAVLTFACSAAIVVVVVVVVVVVFAFPVHGGG